jgi:hypothetical protein
VSLSHRVTFRFGFSVLPRRSALGDTNVRHTRDNDRPTTPVPQLTALLLCPLAFAQGRRVIFPGSHSRAELSVCDPGHLTVTELTVTSGETEAQERTSGLSRVTQYMGSSTAKHLSPPRFLGPHQREGDTRLSVRPSVHTGGGGWGHGREGMAQWRSADPVAPGGSVIQVIGLWADGRMDGRMYGQLAGPRGAAGPWELSPLTDA